MRSTADCAAATLYLLSAEGLFVKLVVAFAKCPLAVVNKPCKRVTSVFNAAISVALTPPAIAC